jgi:3-hydroxyisobutyrate dehydrogenase-like beta-hydroxyacid dehydrogenase
VTSVPTTKHVEGLLKADDGIFKHASKGTYICDTSTIMPQASVEFNKLAKQHGMIFLDTPMSGGITGA